jgi:hypothetical protein
MRTQEKLAIELGFVSDISYEAAVKKLKDIGFLVKEENETNPILLDRLSTYIDQFERERREAYEFVFKAAERIDSETESSGESYDAEFWGIGQLPKAN